MLTLLYSRARILYAPVRLRSAFVAAGVTVVVGVAAAACGGSSTTMPTMEHPTASPAPSGHAGMSGMEELPAGDGLTTEASGFRFVPAAPSLVPNQPTSFRFQIVDKAGAPVTAFKPDQTKLMHLYLIRSDLTGFQHVHPTMAGDGTWTAPLQAVQPGAYRVYASFITTNTSGEDVPLVLSQQVAVTGDSSTTPLPPASTTTQVDGYTLTLAGEVVAGAAHTLTVTVSKDGSPVTDLQPYLDTYAHLSAFHEGDLALAHLHPMGVTNGAGGGPTLSFEAMLPKAGSWRLFVQFQTAGVLHTAAVTLPVS
ncbi:hypothetical protein [Candidatus Protofrankia californiensis]|uniref:hypothetical protein n=1 Tax=Candidatus Protofrankia californiensis TaxID=1839754 RepID=UPI001041B111|nr:hypothetical protein [Candidatus Protofrankia californiensis]